MQFSILKHRKIATEYLNGGLTLLFNNNSNDEKNSKISKYVENTEINGPVIIFKTDYSDLGLKSHLKLQKMLKESDWLGFLVPDSLPN